VSTIWRGSSAPMRATRRDKLLDISVSLCLLSSCLDTFTADCVYRQKIAFYKTLFSLP
jgi:hypothetical protein